MHQQAASNPLLEEIRKDPAKILTLAGVTPDAWQEELIRCDSDRLILLCSRQAGKSMTAAALALREAMLYPESLILVLSPAHRQSLELCAKHLFPLYRRLAHIMPRAGKHENVLKLELANGSRIIALPGKEETIRGFSGVRLLILDEASRIPDGFYLSVRPMIAASKGKLMALSTPWGKRGWFYEAWTGSGAWHRVQVKAADVPRISPEFLEEERREMGDRWYRQEYETSFEDTIDAVFSQSDIEAAMTADLPPLFGAMLQ
jgi:hypothetical protein